MKDKYLQLKKLPAYDCWHKLADDTFLYIQCDWMGNEDLWVYLVHDRNAERQGIMKMHPQDVACNFNFIFPLEGTDVDGSYCYARNAKRDINLMLKLLRIKSDAANPKTLNTNP